MAKKYQKIDSTKKGDEESFPQMDYSDLKFRIEEVILQKYGTQVHAAEKLGMKQNTISSNVGDKKNSTQKISGELLVKLKIDNPELDLNALIYGHPLEHGAVESHLPDYGTIEAAQRKMISGLSEMVKRIAIEQCDEMLSKHKDLLHKESGKKRQKDNPNPPAENA